MSCDSEELRVLADEVKDVVEARFPYNQYEDFLEEQHGKGRLLFELDPSVQPGRIEVHISCGQSVHSFSVKLIRLNKPVESKEFMRFEEDASESHESLLLELKQWLQSF